MCRLWPPKSYKKSAVNCLGAGRQAWCAEPFGRSRMIRFLVVDTLRAIILGTGSGIVVCLVVVFFTVALSASTDFARRFEYYYLFLPLALFAVNLGTRLAPDAKGHGITVIEAIRRRYPIDLIVAPVTFLGSILTIAIGGSAGKVGPGFQTSAALLSALAGRLRLSAEDRRTLMICAISGNFAAVLGAPLAGAVFGTEIIYAKGLLYRNLLPSAIASVVSYLVSVALGFHAPFHRQFVVPAGSTLVFASVGAGIFFGLCSLLFIEVLRGLHWVSGRMSSLEPYTAILAGCLIIGLTFFVSPVYLGLGDETIRETLAGGSVPYAAFLWKTFFTSLTLHFGGVGGIVTPCLFIGATGGSTFGRMLGIDPSLMSALGFVSILSGGLKTPVAAFITAAELFSPEVGCYATIAIVLSYALSGPWTVFPHRKSASQDDT